ncbi:MAG TPA: DUF507 family protein, partial [Geobacterales bacterium]|nr:DUF507 family protein [Geobacterales bacterium]
MRPSEERTSHLAHLIVDQIRRDATAELVDSGRALQATKESISAYFAIEEEVNEAVQRKLASYSQTKVPGSREWDILYQKFYHEEMSKR